MSAVRRWYCEMCDRWFSRSGGLQILRRETDARQKDRMTVRDIVLVLLGALAGFDACAVWWIYTLDRDRNADNRRHPTWPDRTS